MRNHRYLLTVFVCALVNVVLHMWCHGKYNTNEFNPLCKLYLVMP